MKDYREKEIRNLIYMLTFIFLVWCTPALDTLSNMDNDNIYTSLSNILKSSIIASILSCAATLFDCLLSSNLKDKLVGLFFIPRSGETIFSKIKEGNISDSRFCLSDAQALYKSLTDNLPRDKIDRNNFENAKWYQIYQKYQEKGQVSQSQHDYLMCRDLYIETLMVLAAYIFMLNIFPGFIYRSSSFFYVLLFLLIAFNICTHIKMNRFVTTVIAVDIAKNMNDRQSAPV